MTIRECFETYCGNIRLQREVDDTFFVTGDREEWKKNLAIRAKKTREINLENSAALGWLQEKMNAGLTPEEAGEMKDCAVSSIMEGLSDAALHYPTLMYLADFFKAHGDLAGYIVSLFFAGFVEQEILFRSGAMETVSTRVDELIIAERERYGELPDVTTRAYILMAYQNLAVCSVTSHEDIPRAFRYLQEMEEFWASPTVQTLDGENEDLKNYMDTTRRLWLQVSFEPGDRGTPAFEWWCRYAKELFDKMQEETGGDVKQYLIQVYGPYLESRVLLGEMTWEEAAEKFYGKYRDYMDQALGGREEMTFICFGLIPTVNLFADMLDQAGDEIKGQYYGILMEDLSRFGKNPHEETQVDSSINQTLANLCVKSVSIMQGKETKEKALFNLVVKRQLLTYIHAMMTTRIALLIASAAWDALPGYFDETGFTDRQSLLNYVENAGRLHDLGKIYITDIVNMQRRRLDEEEFHGIRRHPQLGAKIVEKDPELSPYRDVILGHHRFYDGKGGYPMSFDNTASPMRRVIDVVTISDCLDAATDCYSRNYKAPKTFPQLLEELKQDAGTRYNPDLVQVMENSPELQAALEKVVNEERLDMMFDAYAAGKEKYI